MKEKTSYTMRAMDLRKDSAPTMAGNLAHFNKQR